MNQFLIRLESTVAKGLAPSRPMINEQSGSSTIEFSSNLGYLGYVTVFRQSQIVLNKVCTYKKTPTGDEDSVWGPVQHIMIRV